MGSLFNWCNCFFPAVTWPLPSCSAVPKSPNQISCCPPCIWACHSSRLVSRSGPVRSNVWLLYHLTKWKVLRLPAQTLRFNSACSQCIWNYSHGFILEINRKGELLNKTTSRYPKCVAPIFFGTMPTRDCDKLPSLIKVSVFTSYLTIRLCSGFDQLSR